MSRALSRLIFYNYVIFANQFVCVAWFSEQDKYVEINKRMTTWLIGNLEELNDI